MSLKSALAAVPDDRLTRSTADGVVRYLYGHRTAYVDALKVATATGMDLDRVESVLAALVDGRVLDFVSEPPGYRLVHDRVLEIEVEIFLRPANRHADSLQSNVERYRRLYGGH